MGLKQENRFQIMLNELAKSLAAVNNVSWEKVKLLYSYCPQTVDDHFVIYPYSLDSIIALGTFFIESKFSHNERIVPYLLKLLKGLTSAKWFEGNDDSDVPYAEKFSFCLNTLLSQISTAIKKDIFIYQTNEIANISSSIISDLKTGFNNLESAKHFYCRKLPIFFGLAQSMMRFSEQDNSYFCHIFPKRKAYIGMIHQIKANYETPNADFISTMSKQGDHVSYMKRTSHQYEKKCCGYPLESVMNVIERVHALLAEDTLTQLRETLHNYKQQNFSISQLYFKNMSDILCCAAMLLYRDVLYQLSHMNDCTDNIKDFVETMYTNVQKYDSEITEKDFDDLDLQKLKIRVSIKVTCIEILARTVKDSYSGENLCAHAASVLKYKHGDNRILVSNTPFIVCCMNVLGTLAQRFPAISDVCVKSLQEFLSMPSSTFVRLYKNYSDDEFHVISEQTVSKVTWFEYCIFKKVQYCAIENLCKSLKSIYGVDQNYIPAFLTKFSSLLFTDKDYPLYELVIENVVVALGHISYSIPTYSLTILQCFQQRLCRHSIESDIAIIHQLGSMLIVNENSEVFLGALKTLSNILIELNGDSKKELDHISTSLVHVLVNVADKLDQQPKIKTVFVKFLEIFVQSGLDELCKSRDSLVPNTGRVSVIKLNQENLLHVLSLLSLKLVNGNQFKKQEERLFQDFWLYQVLSKESLISDHAGDPFLKMIVPNLPTLTTDSLTDHDLREFFYMSSLKKFNVSVSKQNQFKVQILNFLKNTSDINLIVNKLSFPQIIYLHSVCALEIIRIENSERTSIEPLFCYLTNLKLQKDKYGMWQCICKAAEEIFKRFVNTLLEKNKSDERELILETHASMLLIYFNDVNSHIRHIADKFLSELIDSFPHLLWSRKLLWNMLNILSVLEYSLTLNCNEQITCLDVPNSNLKINLMDTKKSREDIFSDFVARSREIVSEARKWAPTVINSHLQEYIIQKENFFEKVGPIGQVRHSLWTLLCSDEKSYQEISDVISSLTVRSRFMGEVAGLLEKSNLPPVEFGKSLAEDVWKACTLENVINYQIGIQRVTAFAVTQPTLHFEIKRVLATSHLQIFTQDTMRTVIQCWYWLCTVHPEFEIEFLTEMFEAWNYTILNRIGLFANNNQCDNPLENNYFQNDSYPHNVWLEFITEQTPCLRYGSQEKLKIIIHFLHVTLPISIGGPECIMSRSVESIVARFSILSSALSLLQTDVSLSCLEQVIIRQRIYCSCLDFFCCLRQFPRIDGLDLKQSINSLVKFWYLLHSDKKHMFKILNVNNLQDSINFKEYVYIADESVDSSKLCCSNTKPIDCTTLYNSFLGDFFKKRKLALCLLAEEIEFLSTWLESSVANSNKVTDWQSTFLASNRSMRDFSKTAWDISPVLAVHLPLRLRRDPGISTEISKMILVQPEAVRHIPHAALLLASAENLENDHISLIHLLTWSEMDPLDTLSLLSQSHPINAFVSQFATRSLLQSSINTLVRFIPQLVQTLRYDFLGYMHNVLLELSRKSPLFCHQLIWNIKSNLYNDVTENKKSNIFDRLNKLLDDVVCNLSGAEKVFFNREFEFVNQITEVSFRIPKNMKGDDKKAACLSCLKSIKVPPGCYLPSSTDELVCDIDYSSGTPLQSRSRTPFLANFLVYKCSNDKVHEIGMQVSEKQMAGVPLDNITINELVEGPKSWHRTIFKAADDVRRDVLALQVIWCFKHIFRNIGLDVFLYPYRVVAVGPGMGVIECIPNAYSRDQLGKQTNVGLYDYFVTTFGDEKSARFVKAQRNFIKSVAAYSLIIFLLQIKDRHNANIMISDEGYIMHIDFGFMFESSPGGNLGFEPDMKITEEMLMIMGGKMESEPFKLFIQLCVKAYLAVRHHQEQIIPLVALMLDSGLPCFRGQTIKLLRGRFAPNASNAEAANYITTVIRNSCLNFRTVTYDMVQYLQNSIQY